MLSPISLPYSHLSSINNSGFTDFHLIFQGRFLPSSKTGTRSERAGLVTRSLFENSDRHLWEGRSPRTFVRTFCDSLGCLSTALKSIRSLKQKWSVNASDWKKKKEAHGDSVDRQQKRKIEREEERLKNSNRDLLLVKMKSMFAIGFAFTALLSMFNSIFDGRVVAKLPFIPISWLQGLSHRNLLGDDYTDCSFIFLYILCTMSIRQNIQKLLGFAPSRAANKHSTNLFGPQPQQLSGYK